MLDNKNSSQKGVTLIETMVALSVLIIGIIAALILATTSLRATEDSKNQMIAANLAREGIEVVKNMRDTNWREEPSPPDPAWKDGLDGGRYVPYFDVALEGWSLESEDFDCFSNHSDENCRIVLVGDGNNIYIQQVVVGGQPTNYYRVIEIFDTGDVLEIHSYVDYQRRGDSWGHVELIEQLTNWGESSI